MFPKLTRLLAAPLSLLLCCACGARTGLVDDHDSGLAGDADTDAEPDTDVGCSRHSDCDDNDLCTENRCEQGLCVAAPAPMAWYDTYEHIYILDSASHQGTAQVLLRAPAIQGYTLDGPVGAERPLPEFEADRDWDAAITSTGEDLFVLLRADEGLNLMRASEPWQWQLLEGAGIYVHLSWSGTMLMASTLGNERRPSWDNCAVAWADPQGRWISDEMEWSPDSCATAQMPWGSGHGPAARPAGFLEDDLALFATVRGSGTGPLLLAGLGEQQVSSFELHAPGPQSYHSLMTVMDDTGQVGGLWIQQEERDGYRQASFAVFDETMTQLTEPLTFDTDTHDGHEAYGPRMATGFCSGRFIGVWFDSTGGAAIQVDRGGELLADVIRFGDPQTFGVGVEVICVDGGAIVVNSTEVNLLGCQ